MSRSSIAPETDTVDINETALEPLANTLELHSDLLTEDRQALLALPHRMRVFDASSPLVTEGQRPTHCAVMLAGFPIGKSKPVAARARLCRFTSLARLWSSSICS